MQARADEQYENMRGARFYRNVDFGLYLLMVIVCALAIRFFLFEPIRVEGDSMKPTLLNGEHMFVEKVDYWFSEPERGDIIICYYPGYKESCVKRIIGLPGETVSVVNGRVLVNGNPLAESRYWNDTIYYDTQPVTVGEREVFVMGDNRNGSKDSRNASVGCIPYHKIVGHVHAVIWPINSFRSIQSEEYPDGNP